MLRELISNEWLTVLIVTCIAILTLAKAISFSRFNDFLGIVINSNYLKIYARDQKFIDQFDALLFINQAINLVIFGFICYSFFLNPIVFDIQLFLKAFLGLSGLILIKVLIERLIGSLFEIDQLIDSYLFQKINYKNYLGLVLLPINIILIFSTSPNSTLIYSAILILVLISFLGFFTSVKTHQKVILNNLFYFILYLCALEIGPYIILYKLFNYN
jgi:hypothetical protein